MRAGRWPYQSCVLVLVLSSGAQQITERPRIVRGRLRYTPAFTKLIGTSGERPADACTIENSISLLACRSFGNLWKTRTTRNFAGFPAFRHIPGIGRCCIVRVLKPAQRV